MALASLIKKLRDIMYNDAGVGDDNQRLAQTVWLLFLKIFDNKEEEWEIVKDEYESIIPIGYRWRDWATCIDEDGNPDIKAQLTGNDLIEFVNTKLMKVLAGDSIKDEKGNDVYLFDKNTPEANIVKEFMKNSTNLMKNGNYLRQIINEIDKVDFTDASERHSFNDVYEQLLKGLQKTSGEFFSPRALTSFIVDKVNPKLGETVADFACGTGGFLVDAINHMIAQKPNLEQREKMQHSFYGVEKKEFPYRLCVTNLFLNDIEQPDILHGNSLERDVRSYEECDKFSCVLMNPPYGGHEDPIVQNNFPVELRSSETADLFVAEITYRLKKDGRCGIILPDGFLFGTDNAKMAIKKRLIENFNLHTIIRLPGSCFAPYTSIATNILFFDNTKEKTKDVWFYRFDLPDGQKFSMTKNPIIREKLKPIDEWWNNRIEIKDEKEDESMSETWRSKKVSVKEIADANYSLDFCGYPVTEKVILSPEETIKNFKEEREKLDKKMDEKLAEILSLLGIKED